MKEKERHARRIGMAPDGRIHEHVGPKELSPLELKVNAICALAVNETVAIGPANLFMSFPASRREDTYRVLREDYPVESERLAQARRVLGEKSLQSQAETVNRWLTNKGRPELQVTVDEILKISYGD